MKNHRNQERTISGTLFPAKFDENRQVVQLVVDTTDQDTYFILNNAKGKELSGWLHRNVEMTGAVEEGENGNFFINVREYRLLDTDGEGKGSGEHAALKTTGMEKETYDEKGETTQGNYR